MISYCHLDRPHWRIQYGGESLCISAVEFGLVDRYECLHDLGQGLMIEQARYGATTFNDWINASSPARPGVKASGASALNWAVMAPK